MSSFQVPATSSKGAGPSMLEGQSGYGSTMQDSPKFTSGDYPVATQKYGQKGEKMLTDYPSGREIDSHMLKEQVHILGEICKMSHLFGLLIPLLLVINTRFWVHKFNIFTSNLSNQFC